MPAIKKARYTEEPVFVNLDGTLEPYIPKDIITNRGAYATSLHLVFKHVADFHTMMVEIIAEKTGLDSDAIFDTIKGDERYKNMLVSPQIHSLGAFEKEDLQKVVAVEEVTESMSTMKIDEVKPKKIRVVKKKV
jgi:hypothetical protein